MYQLAPLWVNLIAIAFKLVVVDIWTLYSWLVVTVVAEIPPILTLEIPDQSKWKYTVIVLLGLASVVS